MSSRRKTKKKFIELSPSREVAFRVLRRVEERREDPATALHHSSSRELSPADRDLATEIVYGVLRWRARLDYVIAAHAKRALSKIDPVLLRALRIGLYQLRFLSRIPPHAAVDESVRLARAFRASRGAGLVNAVLRSTLRRPELPSLPDRANQLDYLSVALSHPRWLVQRYLARDGFETAERRCTVQNEAPSVFLRVSHHLDLDAAQRMLSDDGVSAEIFPLVPGCLRVVSGRVQQSKLYEKGLVFIQDAGSQLVPRLVAAKKGEPVLDLCAAPGAKSTGLAELAGVGSVIALDLRLRRAGLIASLADRLGMENVRPVVADVRRLPTMAFFERILLDVPCSSLGTVRRNPDIKWRVCEEDLDAFSALQSALLRSASERLAVGGRLVYATCSSEPEENEAVVEGFLAVNESFHLVDCGPSLPESARHLAAEGVFRTFPERDAVDGYFAAVLTRAR
ncbi:MAG TPA: 16S rRNA (cytosine(967)-C(5))-methyltransferase RsmB [Vicinamibacteria bacterium]|nr:16S rRNA (cytosine(967)-C(5))-methyltransferase RsmB [Vicinamibacteria bacterium]